MINPEKSFNIHDYIEIFLRQKWYIIIPFAIVLTGAFLFAIVLPKVNSATATILVSPQSE
jgi:uncharacterized protein involved in exopolysaccharide biosynthesis